ncbi:hypothetical protein KSF_084980 [Reticulibacter mediterranei]|uniref:Uncharacterized protein n=1 Tax=Reticulibacter mediterranei TaxID=2778369 RepID=A0A8J3ITV6_9CHLR|nr:phage portal protein [Reticulibacter mediterranei]GHO98450.1 hypothetical protein KSF_084980 [Reticulibacter mediterranei]
MRFLDRFLKSSIYPDEEQIQEQIDPTLLAFAAPTQEDYTWSKLTTGGEEDYYWRRLSDVAYQKDLMPSTYLELHNLIYESYHANPLAFAIIEMTTSFVLGKGITVDAVDREVQRVLLDFWRENTMDERIYNICTELALYGEIFVRFFINKYNGSVKVRLIDPSLIDLIESDPEDIETPVRFHRRPVVQTISATDPATMQNLTPITKLDISTSYTQGEWYRAGEEMLQFAINKVSNARRGNSDLATLLPWLRRYKDWLTDRVRINKYKSVFLYDVTLRGADKKAIDRKKMEYTYPPEPGSVIIHNETEQWSAVQPQIQANDAKEDGRAIKLMIAAGAGLPEHYLRGEGTPVKRGEYCTSIRGSMCSLRAVVRREVSRRKRFSSSRWMTGWETLCTCVCTSP